MNSVNYLAKINEYESIKGVISSLLLYIENCSDVTSNILSQDNEQLYINGRYLVSGKDDGDSVSINDIASKLELSRNKLIEIINECNEKISIYSALYDEFIKKNLTLKT